MGSGDKLGPGEWLRADRTRKGRTFSDWSREDRNGEGRATHRSTWTGELGGEETVCSSVQSVKQQQRVSPCLHQALNGVGIQRRVGHCECLGERGDLEVGAACPWGRRAGCRACPLLKHSALLVSPAAMSLAST